MHIAFPDLFNNITAMLKPTFCIFISHSLYECKYHVIFCPKYMYKILQKEISSYITQQIYRLTSQKEGIEVLGLNVQPEHIHLIASIPPKYAVSQYMGFLKGKLALNLFYRYLELRKRYYSGKSLCQTSIW
ncbi:MAG: IS200/IS605 family transposase [Desulfamplus sp.]|nr:IS200/IS605 family transposase [Desulfamplus sp.]